MTHSDYISKIRFHLPPQAFRPAPAKRFLIFMHLGIIFSCYVTFRFTSSVVISLLLSVVISHSRLCIGFFAHELAHGAIVRNRLIRYPIEVFLWELNFVPATMWRRVHNQTHHVHANTPLDPDRPYLASEKTWATRCYTYIFYPQRRFGWLNPLIAFHWTGYVLRNIVALFYRPSAKPRLVPACPRYSACQKSTVIIEICFILFWQVMVFFVVGRTWPAWVWASVVSYLFTSAFVMLYIFTNHFLNPISETHDPLAHTTSVTVPRFMDQLHQHFSLHTEHHLFPSMNSDYYPLVASALKREFPDRYNVLPLAEAWKRLWRQNYFSNIQNTK